MMNTSHSRSARSILATCAALLFLLLPSSCRGGGGGTDSIPLGTYYTRCSINIDRNRVLSTNYRGGAGAMLVPVNTKVDLISRRRGRFNMKTESGQSFRFEHVRKHSNVSADDSFKGFFSAAETDLSDFSAEEQAGINEATAKVGMSKDAVLAAIGPPPGHKTRSLSLNTWMYWSKKFDTFNVQFDDDGKVSQIVD